MHLTIFDVDGTLTRSTAIDSRCYAQAVAETLAFQIDTDWSRYRHTTDAGVLNEVLERHGIRETPAVVTAVRQRFVQLLSAGIAADPNCCAEVPGARVIIKLLRDTPDFQVAIATGGWRDSARLKLRQAGVDVDRLPFASSDDSSSRQEILRIARERASASGASFCPVTYIGDAPWDVSAARSLGFRFIGVGCDGGRSQLEAAGASDIVADFTDQDAFIARLGRLTKGWS